MKTLVTQFLRGAGLTGALLLPLLALAQTPAQEATIRKNLVERLPGLPKIDEIRRTPMNAWPRYWQDAAISTIHNWERTGAGASHWAGGRWHC